MHEPQRKGFGVLEAIFPIVQFMLVFYVMVSVLDMIILRRRRQPQGFYTRDRHGNLYFIEDDDSGQYKAHRRN